MNIKNKVRPIQLKYNVNKIDIKNSKLLRNPISKLIKLKLLLLLDLTFLNNICHNDLFLVVKLSSNMFRYVDVVAIVVVVVV